MVYVMLSKVLCECTAINRQTNIYLLYVNCGFPVMKR